MRAGTPRLSLSISGVEKHPGLPSRSTLRRWVSIALERDASLCLVFADARAGRALNREYRGRDYATNVLTFSYRVRPDVLADIVLCVPVLRREAREAGLALRAHLAHLLVHGVLHAHGYDHERGERQARRMQGLERRHLAGLGVPDPYLPEKPQKSR
jgi:probable rRNA maturation factor